MNYEPRNCQHCEKVFVPNRKDKIYCKKHCQRRASERRQSGWQEKKLRYHPYRKHKKKSCECCGFVAVHPIQLDIDHIDGNHENNSLTNLQTLCSNCHRLKTWLNRDWENKKAVEDFSPTA